MQDTGIILSIENGKALVKLEHSHNCESCGLCTAGKKKYEIEAIDNVGVSKGDRVKIDIASAAVLKFTFSVYIIPILSALIGYFLTYLLISKSEDAGIIGSVLFLVVSLIIVFKIRNKKDKTHNECIIIEKL
jgi:positive regulator of sigma E activity